jgi:hypothetical protein
VLIKSILSSLPIFQFYALFALVGIKKDLAHAILNFLWQLGKSNTNTFHLVNWSLVRSPKENGGLGV